MTVTILAVVLGSSLMINIILFGLLKTSKKVQNTALESVADLSNYIGDTIKATGENFGVQYLKDKLTSKALKSVLRETAKKSNVAAKLKDALTSLWSKGKAKIKKF